MGRRKKPTHLKIVENSRDRRDTALVYGEPVPVGPLDEAPDHFSDAERETWGYVIRNAPRGMLKMLDRFALQAFVEAWETRRQAQEKLRNSPLIIRTATGNISQSPFLRIVNQQNVIIRGFVAELGFSPAARTGIAIEQEDEADPTDRFFPF